MTAPARADTPPIRFGPQGRFELRPSEYRLLIDGQPAALGGRALDLLFAFAARPAQLLTKDELLDLVWPGLVVEEGNLRVQVNNLRKLLGDDVVTTVPGRGYRFSAALWADAAAPAAAAAAAPEVVPLLAPRLFGRDGDLARLQALLQADRGGLVTLVGTSGVGKSSLARAAMARRGGRAVWVDLAAATPATVTAAVARSLGLAWSAGELAPLLLQALPPPSAAVEPLLLVLDNAEHVIESCAEVVSQLAGVPALRLLVTSQLPLAVVGEHVMRVEPLSLGAVPAGAAAGETATADLGDGALALLVDRITAVDRRYRATAASLPLLQSLCEQLDGLPLALEMAAARVPLMGLRAVHDALAQRFSLLNRGRRDSPARHRTLHDALDWSYRLLPPAEQRLFRILGLFAGGFSLDLAIAVAADEAAPMRRWEVVDGVAGLVDRSLVSVGSAGDAAPLPSSTSAEDPPRYRMLETMRAFALEQLAATEPPAQVQAARARHAAALLALFDQPSVDPLRPDPRRLVEMENAREAFFWARDHDLDTAARLSSQLAQASVFSPWRQDAIGWMLSLEPAMVAAGDGTPPLPLPLQAKWWVSLAHMLNTRQDSAATAAARRAVSLWRQVQPPEGLLEATVQWVRSCAQPGAELDEATAALQALTVVPGLPARDRLRVQGALARAARTRGDRTAILEHHRAEAALARELGWARQMQTAESNVCNALNELGRHAEAAERGRALLADIDASDGELNGNLPWVFNSLIEALTAIGALDEAQALVRRAIAASRRYRTQTIWLSMVRLAAARQRWRAVAGLLGHIRQSWGATLRDDDPADDDGKVMALLEARVTAELGAFQAEALVMRGRALDDDAVAALAVGDPVAAPFGPVAA